MAIIDLWVGRDGQPTKRHGRGMRYRVEVRGHPSRAFAGKQAARTWELELLRRPPLPPESMVTVGELVDLWLAGKMGLSRDGVTAAKGDARHVKAEWGDARVSEVHAHEVQAWIAELRAVVGKGANRVERPASTAMRQRLLGCLSGAMRIGVRTGVIQRSPCDDVVVPRGDRREPRFLDAGELRELAAACDAWADHGVRRLPGYWAPLVLLLGTTGLRVGEAAALRVGDVDAGRRRLRVRRAKSGRGRDVAIPEPVIALLDLDRRPDAALFVGPDGGALDPDVWRRRSFARAVQARGLGDLRIHDLRHTAASLAIASGASVMHVQATLGHARASTTLDIYAHLLDDGLDDVARRMGERLGELTEGLTGSS